MAFTVPDYLRRIGWPAPEEPVPLTLQSLIQLQKLHHSSVKFDNFDLHLNQPIFAVDTPYVWSKVKDNTRGTFCFQGNYLFLTAIQMMGFEALLVPVCTWRPFANSFVEVPSHCSVIVSIENGTKWVLIDVATVDCIDGVLILTDSLREPQPTANGLQYKFDLIPDVEYECPPDLLEKLLAIDPTADFLRKKCVTATLVKHDIKRDTALNPIEPQEKEWINRFSFRLPLKSDLSTYAVSTTKLADIATLPRSLNQKQAELLVEYTTVRDTRSHHYKQWVGINYTKDGKEKKIVSGFRFITCQRPYSKRDVKACTTSGVAEGEQVPQKDIDAILNYLKDEIGIVFSEEFLKNLKISHNYFMPNVDHVWPY